MESIMAADMKDFKFTIPMPADSTASSFPCYIQLAFPNGTIFVFKTFTATLEDWTALFSLVDGEHTILISFDGADDWAGIDVLLGRQFRTDRQKKNKDAVVKAIHFNAHCIIRNIAIYSLLYELARKIEFILEKRTLKATVSAIISIFHPSDHGRPFCLGTQTNGFRDTKTLTGTTYPKVLSIPKIPKKKKKKEKDEWNKSPEIIKDDSLDLDDTLRPLDFYAARDFGSILRNMGLNLATIDPTLGRKYEGDIDWNRGRRLTSMPQTYKIQTWPGGVVPYVLSHAYLPLARSLIARVFDDIEQVTCVKFVPRTNQKNYVRIFPHDRECYSSAGMIGGMQKLSLGPEKKENKKKENKKKERKEKERKEKEKKEKKKKEKKKKEKKKKEKKKKEKKKKEKKKKEKTKRKRKKRKERKEKKGKKRKERKEKKGKKRKGRKERKERKEKKGKKRKERKERKEKRK
uniref:Peptidase M12A domain-containing protein n=1 Tax=Romanomermis culicivorax TaxID=13658 RepID=A0A915HLV3_ROMCU